MENNKEIIFLAEDDEDDRLFFSMAVDSFKKNIKLVTFNDGEELIKNIKTEIEKPQIIFLDINMPKLSGLECLERIRRSSNWKHVPVAMYSTSGNESDIEQSKKLGAQVFVMKPFQLTKLAEIIDWALHVDWGNTVLSSTEFFVREKTWHKKPKNFR